MLEVLAQFFFSAAAIIAAGTFLTRYADAIADLTGFGRLLVGSILLAGATSLPELVVDIHAVQIGSADLAVGDLMGSSLFNILILAFLDLSRRSRGRMISRALMAHALAATATIALAALAAAAILLTPTLMSASIGPVGVGTIAILVAYAFCIRLIFYDQRVAAEQTEIPEQDVLVPAAGIKLRKACVGFVLAATVIVIAGPYLAVAADELATLSGLGQTFIGTTLVALCTSLPEFVACFVAVRMGAFDLAVGNIFGSNAFNMVLLFPLDLVHDGPVLAVVSDNHAITALATIVVTSVAIMGQLYRAEKKYRFIEPDAFLVLVLAVLGGLYYLR